MRRSLSQAKVSDWADHPLGQRMTGTVGAYRSGFATNVTLRTKPVDVD